MTRARFITGTLIGVGAKVYIAAKSGDEAALTTDEKMAHPKHKKPVGVIEPGPTFRLNPEGESLLKALE